MLVLAGGEIEGGGERTGDGERRVAVQFTLIEMRNLMFRINIRSTD